MNKTGVEMNKRIYLGQSMLDISKTFMYQFWYGYLKPKYGDKIKLCYTNTDSFVNEVKTENLYTDIFTDVEKWYDTSNYDKDDNRPFLVGINKKIPGLHKDELEGKIMTEFYANRAKTYAFAMDDGKKLKKRKKTIMLKDYKNSLFNDEVIQKPQLRFKSNRHDVYTKKKIK